MVQFHRVLSRDERQRVQYESSGPKSESERQRSEQVSSRQQQKQQNNYLPVIPSKINNQLSRPLLTLLCRIHLVPFFQGILEGFCDRTRLARTERDGEASKLGLTNHQHPIFKTPRDAIIADQKSDVE